MTIGLNFKQVHAVFYAIQTFGNSSWNSYFLAQAFDSELREFSSESPGFEFLVLEFRIEVSKSMLLEDVEFGSKTVDVLRLGAFRVHDTCHVFTCSFQFGSRVAIWTLAKRACHLSKSG